MEALLERNLKRFSEYDEHTQVFRIEDKTCDLLGYIAVHRQYGAYPSFGATRFAEYTTEDDALRDALRLSRLMSYKSAMAGLPYGGAKAVLISPKKISEEKRTAILLAYAGFVNALKGRFITGTDMGISQKELQQISHASKYFVGLRLDPSAFTVLGLYNGILAAVMEVFGNDDLTQKTFAVQGLGKVGFGLVRKLYPIAKKIYVTDLSASVLQEVKKQYPNVIVVQPREIYRLAVDVFSPCATAGAISEETINEFQCKIIAGGANNQLAHPSLGRKLHDKGILYVPDYVLNAGGILSVAGEFENPHIHDLDMVATISRIPESLQKIFEKAKKTGLPESFITDQMTKNILKKNTAGSTLKEASHHPLQFPLPPFLADALSKEASGVRRKDVVGELLHELKTHDSDHWEDRGQRYILALFRVMVERIPAYKDFLYRHNGNARKIISFEDFLSIPITNKENYLLHYATQSLCWDGRFSEESWMISSTSGSTGKAFYFPRSKYKDEEFALTAELCFREYFQIDKRRTLFIDCFALGVWIGGMFMYQALKRIADKGEYPLSIITPGADKGETLKAITRLASMFDQVIIGGYGPLVKDLIDDGIAQGVRWEDYTVRYFFAAEGFTEGFRDYVVKKGGAQDVLSDTINHYGTADLGTMAHETPLSIFIRRKALENKELYRTVFSDAHRLPTLAQFVPELFFFEEVDGRLLCSGLGGFPLMRYDLKDRGGVVSFKEMHERFLAHGINLLEEAESAGISAEMWKLPFVYVYERNDLTVSIYSVNIYPESIRRALEISELEPFVTGKFMMSTEFDAEQNQFLQIVVELKHQVLDGESLMESVKKSITRQLHEENSEWRDFYNDTGIRAKILPRILFRPYQDPEYFRAGRKQQWVKKNSGVY